MPSALLESPIREAFIYGRVSGSLSLVPLANQANHRPDATEAELRDIFQRTERFTQHQILDEVAPTLEQLVQDSGAEIGTTVTARVSMKREFLDALLAAQFDCEVMADVDDDEVIQVVEDQLVEPLRAYTYRLEEEVAQDHRRQQEGDSRPTSSYTTPFDPLVNRVLDTLRSFGR